MLVQGLQGIDLGDWYQKVPPREPHQSLDVPLLVGPSHQAEVFLKQVMALEPQKLLGQLALSPLQYFNHGNGRVVVADPPGHAAEVLKGPAMPFQEGLRAFPRKGLDENRSRVGQRHHEQGDLRLLARQPDRRFAEVDLGLARRMRQRQKDLPMRLPPGSNGVLHHGLAALKAVLSP